MTAFKDEEKEKRKDDVLIKAYLKTSPTLKQKAGVQDWSDQSIIPFSDLNDLRIKLINNKRIKDDIESVPIDTKSLFFNMEPIIKSVKINYNLRYANKKTSIQDHLNRLVYHFPTINSLDTWRRYSIIDSSYVGS